MGEYPQTVVEFNKVRKKLIAKGEDYFSIMIKEYPHKVLLPQVAKWYAVSEEDMVDYCNEIEDWLEENINPENFRAFPIDAIGKYSDWGNCIMFRYAADAVWFKLVHL